MRSSFSFHIWLSRSLTPIRLRPLHFYHHLTVERCDYCECDVPQVIWFQFFSDLSHISTIHHCEWRMVRCIQSETQANDKNAPMNIDHTHTHSLTYWVISKSQSNRVEPKKPKLNRHRCKHCTMHIRGQWQTPPIWHDANYNDLNFKSKMMYDMNGWRFGLVQPHGSEHHTLCISVFFVR